jgi:hypothetical protein
MNTAQKKLHLITYGLGNAFDIAKFKSVRNRNFVKPHGGLWASPVTSDYGWCDWCKDENFGNLKSSFVFEFTGNVLVIDSFEHAKEMPWRNLDGLANFPFPDFEKIAEAGVDAIHLTDNGQQVTRFSEPSLYGWDCECVLIINPEGVICQPSN